MKITQYKKTGLLIALLLASINAKAVDIPSSGEVLRENKPAVDKFVLPSQEGVNIPSPRMLDEKPGGVKISLKQIKFEGNTVYSSEELRLALGDVSQTTFDLGGLRGLANKISDYYRNNGYSFARAFLPAQSLTSGVLSIGVAEGYYGDVSVTGVDQGVLSAFASELEAGALIESKLLERKILIMQDIPGIKIFPVMRPGEALGSGDLNIIATRDKKPSAFVSIDNHGSRYTGAYRLRGYFSDNNLLSTGDQLQANLLLSDESLVFGSVAYDRLVGYKGWRAGASFIKTDYQIAEIDRSLKGVDTQGIAQISSLTASYPLIRSQHKNVNLFFQVDYKQFTDKSLGIETSKHTYAVPIGLNFNGQDSYFGGGLTYGSLQATVGNLTIESSAAKNLDKATAKTSGHFIKFNLDITRLQNLRENVTLFVNMRGQWANNNLDSSEEMSLGGAQAVRAYPSGEGSADRALLGQVEVRYSLPMLTPFVFYDVASGWINSTPWDRADNKRTISSAGIGFRSAYKQLSGELLAAFRLDGGQPLSDTEDKSPRIWTNLSYHF